MSHITPLVNAAGQGDQTAAAELFQVVYNDLRRIAATRIDQEKPGQTLQPTSLVHEVYLRLFGLRLDGKDRSKFICKSSEHFFAAAAEAMRRILVDSARRKRRTKHGGRHRRSLSGPEQMLAEEPADELIALNDAMEALSETEPQLASFVKLRYFAGFTIKEASATMGISERTGNTYWSYARAWLLAEMQRRDENA